MNKAILEKLMDEAQEEEKINFSPEFSAERRIRHILSREGSTIRGLSLENVDYSASYLLNGNITIKAKENFLEICTLLASAAPLIEYKPEYKKANLESLAEKISLDIYVDFFPYLVLGDRKKKKRHSKDKTDSYRIKDSVLYFKDIRPDLKGISERISQLYEGVEEGIKHIDSLVDLRNIAAANIILKYYPDGTEKREVQQKIIDGYPASEMFVYSILRYHQSLLRGLE